jgi:hypothetical protein
MKLIRQIALTVTWTELKSSNAASLVMLPAANQRQAPSSRSLGAVHDGYERSEFARFFRIVVGIPIDGLHCG